MSHKENTPISYCKRDFCPDVKKRNSPEVTFHACHNQCKPLGVLLEENPTPVWRWFSAFTFSQFEHSVITQIVRTAEGARPGSRCITRQAQALVSTLMLPPVSWEQRNKKKKLKGGGDGGAERISFPAYRSGLGFRKLISKPWDLSDHLLFRDMPNRSKLFARGPGPGR